jgi:hypothetical protein
VVMSNVLSREKRTTLASNRDRTKVAGFSTGIMRNIQPELTPPCLSFTYPPSSGDR